MTPVQAVAFVLWRHGCSCEPSWEQVANRYKISRASAYRWLKAYRKYTGEECSLNRLLSVKWA